MLIASNAPPPHRCAPRRSVRRIHHRLSAVIISSKASQFTECTYTSHAMSPLTSTRLHKFVCRTHSYRYRGYIHDVSTGGTSMKTQAKIARCAAFGVPQNMVCCMHTRSCEFHTIAQYIYVYVGWIQINVCCLHIITGAFIIGVPCVYIYIYPQVPAHVRDDTTGKPVFHGVVDRCYNRFRRCIQLYCLVKQEESLLCTEYRHCIMHTHTQRSTTSFESFTSCHSCHLICYTDRTYNTVPTIRSSHTTRPSNSTSSSMMRHR